MFCLVSLAPLHAVSGEMPDVLIKVDGGYSNVELFGTGLRIYGSDLDPEAKCLTETSSDEAVQDGALEALISTGGKAAAAGEEQVRQGAERFTKISSFPGKLRLKFAVKAGKVAMNGEGTGHSHVVVETEDGSVTFGGKGYRGRMELVAGKGGLIVINRIPLESYLRGMLDAEMSHSWPLQALKAQAVAARTYAVYQKYYGGRCHYHLESTVLSQVYKGLAHEQVSTIQAVEETKGEILSIAGDPVMAQFHSCCGGMTQDSASVFGRAMPGLKSVKCGFDSSCPSFKWTRNIKLTAVTGALQKAKLYSGEVTGITGDGAGKVEISGSAGLVKLRMAQVRAAVGYNIIPGGRFKVRVEGDSALFNGGGSGHGVGMCQYGARGMAEAGRDYREILQHYFKDAEIVRLY